VLIRSYLKKADGIHDVTALKMFYFARRHVPADMHSHCICNPFAFIPKTVVQSYMFPGLDDCAC
jgi:hypothetical protein